MYAYNAVSSWYATNEISTILLVKTKVIIRCFLFPRNKTREKLIILYYKNPRESHSSDMLHNTRGVLYQVVVSPILPRFQPLNRTRNPNSPLFSTSSSP